jgi:phospholipid/cholesterol/gamma-HCH transport system substrate-binding protein
MATKTIHNVKLGIFVLSGLLFLILLLYMIGRNGNLFQATYTLKARFDNTQGLVVGNNVRFAGIETGTVKRISIVNDSVIEVTMVIDKDMRRIIRKNAIVSIGTEGLVGNKLVNIVPSKSASSLAEDGDMLASRKAVDTDAMLRVLNSTNNDVAAIAAELRSTVQRINRSNGLWELIDDKSIPHNIRASVANIQSASGKTLSMVNDLNALVTDVRAGKGSVGTLLTDTSFAQNLNRAVLQIQTVGNEADSLAGDIRELIAGMEHDVTNGKGTVNALFKDSVLVTKLNASLDNIQMGTDGFNQNMEALKHNFLFRGYFRKMEKKNKKNGNLVANPK